MGSRTSRRLVQAPNKYQPTHLPLLVCDWAEQYEPLLTKGQGMIRLKQEEDAHTLQA